MTQTKKAAKREYVSPQIIVQVVIIILASSFGNLSQTATNAMLSGIAEDFQISLALGQWVTTLYMLVIGITVPVVTFLMRRFSLRQLILFSLGIFLLGCAVDIVAPVFGVLLLGRAMQAVSAGILMPMMMSVVMTSFPPNKRATVMGIAGIAMGFAPNIGPTIGGILITTLGWRSLFSIMIVVMVVLIVITCLCVKPGPKHRPAAYLDIPSLVLSALGFGFLLLGFSNASDTSNTALSIVLPLLVGAVALVIFIRRQKRIEHPLISMEIFASKKYVAGFWAANFLFASFMGITLVVPLFIEDVWGGTALDGGMALLPGTIAALFFNPLSGYLTDKIGIRPVVLFFGGCLVVGAVSMAFIDESTPFWVILLLQGIRASGVSGLISPLTSWSMEDLPGKIMTDGSSFNTAARQAIASMGTALMVLLITLGLQLLGSASLGFHLAFGLSGVFAVLMYLIVLTRVR